MARQLETPLDVYWSLTQGCNFECNFCFTSSGPGATDGDLSQEERARVLAQIVEARVLRVVLTGGEPLIVPEFLDIVRTLRAAGIGVKITTNGALLRAPLVRALAEVGVRLQFSIESDDPRINDILMGSRDTRKRVLDGLVRAREAGIPSEVKITMQAANAEGLSSLYRFLHEHGVEKIDVTEVAPLGRAIGNWSRLEVAPEVLARAQAEAEAAQALGIPVVFGATRLQNAERGVPALCSLGSPRPRTVLIDERGDVRPCAASQSFGWSNHVLEHGLLGAWDRLTELGKYRDADALEGVCRTCDLVATCKGGCRGIAYGVWGHLKGPDPYCPRLGAKEGRPVFGREITPVLVRFPDGSQTIS